MKWKLVFVSHFELILSVYYAVELLLTHALNLFPFDGQPRRSDSSIGVGNINEKGE